MCLFFNGLFVGFSLFFYLLIDYGMKSVYSYLVLTRNSTWILLYNRAMLFVMTRFEWTMQGNL